LRRFHSPLKARGRKTRRGDNGSRSEQLREHENNASGVSPDDYQSPDGYHVSLDSVLLRAPANLLSITSLIRKGDRVVADGRHVWVYLPSNVAGTGLRLTSAIGMLRLSIPARCF
jgi:hypothetical protein